MATPITVSCRECGKQMKAPAELAGKKIRCKGCEAVIVVPAAKVKTNAVDTRMTTAAPPLPTPGGTLTSAQKNKLIDDEADDGKVAFGVIEESLAPRCPGCANELDPPDAKVCLHCGYNLAQRKKVERRVTIEHTFGDYLIWHGLPILALIGIVILWGGLWYFYFQLPPKWFTKWNESEAALKVEAQRQAPNTEVAVSRMQIVDKVAETESWLAYLMHPGIFLWMVVPALFTSYRGGAFAFRRFILHPIPPDKIVSADR